MKNLILTLSVLFSINGHGGDWSSSGTDKGRIEDGAAWFLGKDKVVNYCIVQEESFSLDRETVKRVIKKSFKTWKDYIEKKGINNVILTDDFDWKIATKFELQENCNNSPLKFKIGTPIPQRDSEKYSNPLAFAHRAKYDFLKGHSKGYIWVKKEFSEHGHQWDEKKFTGIILHEIGHVKGVGHVDRTIMRADIYNFLRNPRFGKKSRLDYSEIDHDRALVSQMDFKIPDNQDSIVIELDKGIIDHDIKRGNNTFFLLTGKKAKGVVKAFFRETFRKRAIIKTVQHLILKDDESEFKFLIEDKKYVHYSGAENVFEGKIFKRVFKDDFHNAYYSYGERDNPYSCLAKIVDHKNKKHLIHVDFNSNKNMFSKKEGQNADPAYRNTKYLIHLVNNGDMIPIFSRSAYYRW